MEKILTIKNNTIFTKMYRSKSSPQGTVVLYYRYNPRLSKANVGITASKKLGGAVQRNRVRRIIREAYRNLISEYEDINSLPYYFVFVARSRCFSSKTRMQDVYADLKRAFSDAGILGEKE